jgi:CubicO group peptidase (beta-lactamase class C family)
MGLVRHAFQVCFTIGTLIALSACGGGGGGGGDPSPGNPPNNPPPGNQAPTASAGEDQTIDLATGTVTLAGSGADADGDTLTYEWSSSPAENVSFDDATSPTSTVTFSAAGTYELTLTVSDGEDSATDAVQITVTEEPVAGQPVVQAGEDQTIELPVNSVTLDGSATDDSGAELTYSWTAEPADGVTFADAAAASTTATFDAEGTYVLTLSASNESATGSDSVQIVVDPAVYPGPDDNGEAHGWLTAAPADVGLDETLLAQARDYAVGTGGTGSGVIVRYGRLVYSWGNIDQRFDVKSATKSIGGITLGLALEDDVVELESTANTYLPTIGSPPYDPADPRTDSITLLQLATHTSGFEKDGGYGELQADPGTTFLYSDGGLNWLADTLTEAYQQDLNVVMTDRVWNTLGIVPNGDVIWRDNNLRPDPHPLGIPRRELASGIIINANAMARVGLLFLRNGEWAGAPVITKEFVDTVRTPRPEIAGLPITDEADFPEATTNYGVLWWTNTTGMLADVPTDAYWAWGLGDSLIVVIPSLDLVIARTDNANTPVWRTGWNGDYAVLAPFLNPIVQSAQE